MSFEVCKIINFPQPTFQYVPQEVLTGEPFEDLPILGGILSDLKHVWHSKGPCLELRHISTGRKVGAWTFGGILKDSNTKIVAVDEIKRSPGRLGLLVVALDCTISGGLVCIFDIFGSKVVRTIQVREKIISLHVIDSGCENSVLPEPSPLRYFDGIIAIGAQGGNVFLVDICRQICENALQNADVISVRDELNPCQMVVLKKEKIGSIKKYVERSVENEEHLAIHLNVVLNSSTEHFTLQGENGEDRVHVNRSEAEVSSVFYSSQIASLLVGYNFGAFQLWDLRSLELLYTSPICEEHIPVTHFNVQEPADDPKAYCYIWVSYSHNLFFHSGLPFAVMYSFYFDTKSYVNGYGSLYEDFQHCSVRFQIELGDTQISSLKSRVKGGTCIGLQSLSKMPINRDLSSLSLCLISWLMWNSNREVVTSVLLFDLNQWYKEQMPNRPNWSECSNYIIKHSLEGELLDIQLDPRTLSQFIGIQRLEEHFCPTSLSCDLYCLTDVNVQKVHNKGLQQAFIDKIEEDGHLSLVRPEDYYEQIVLLGLVPLFCDIPSNSSLDIDYQREVLLNVALEQKLISWLCKCTSKLANNAFNGCGLTIFNIINWAFQRAITLKSCCDKYCVSLFDYSAVRLDNNTIALINNSTSQIKNICSFYRYISSNLLNFISDIDALLEEQRCLENVIVYFEVLLWMVNIGLLPECHPSCYPKPNVNSSSLNAPYLINDLTQYYDRKRAQLQLVSHDTFVEKDCLLFVDNLINHKGAEVLRQQWQEDGGSGLYPPPSLQSVLRMYFLDGPDLIFKHSLVTYTLLDIAMTVEENNKVIKLLLKFPQIFDLSQSHIKIVQAFWHLDHDDYEIALEYILDPCVLSEDLHHWHHAVMMRSLLLQEQYNLALLYLQIRKPSITDEKDLLTVISLLVSKNMLDEAFKFRQQHQAPNEQALLMHIFNECNKNELLHTLLYRCLNTEEERTFFKYLQTTKSPRCEDLKVFYYLLRSRFLEAFDIYSVSKRKKPENQGLVGQRDATTADNIVKMFRSLLPDVNKNLVEVVRKERTNLWKEVKRPTPLSVFVHNARDQISYKSSIIFAALAKAKQTFNNTLNGSKLTNDVVTEETPFLRTPTGFRNVSRLDTPLVKSRVIKQNETGDYGPSPCKRLKLSPRASTTSPLRSRNLSISDTIQSKISTPIIKRKISMKDSMFASSYLPQSILKGSLTKTILDDSILDRSTSVNTSAQLECENSIRRSKLALTPRKPLSRTPLKTHVKFDDLRYSSSSNDLSKSEVNLENSRRMSIDSTGTTVSEEFFSPNNSVEISEVKVSEMLRKEEVSKLDDTLIEEVEGVNKEEGRVRIPIEDNLTSNRLMFQSPRSRRSYKRSLGENAPVRSSPRLAKKSSFEESNKEDSTSSQPNLTVSESVPKPSPSVAIQKLRGRRSLSRAVLENNAFSNVRSSNIFEESGGSVRSSVNTTFEESDDDEDMEEGPNDSLDEFLMKYGQDTPSLETSLNKDTSFGLVKSKNEDVLGGQVLKKVLETESTETHRESLSMLANNSEEMITSSKVITQTFHSKKVEIFGEEKPGVFENDDIGFKAIKDQDVNKDKDVTVGQEDRWSEVSVVNQEGSNSAENEEINVYEDLSSGSEDVRNVLQQNRAIESEENATYADISYSTSESYYQSNQKTSGMPINIMESDNSNNGEASKSSQSKISNLENDYDMEVLLNDNIPITEKAFVFEPDNDVIEIGSSEDEARRKKNSSSTSQDSTSIDRSSSEENGDSSVDSRHKEQRRDDSPDWNVIYERNLNENFVKRVSVSDESDEEVKKIIEGDLEVSNSEIASDHAIQNDEHMDSLILEENTQDSKDALVVDDEQHGTEVDKNAEDDAVFEEQSHRNETSNDNDMDDSGLEEKNTETHSRSIETTMRAKNIAPILILDANEQHADEVKNIDKSVKGAEEIYEVFEDKKEIEVQVLTVEENKSTLEIRESSAAKDIVVSEEMSSGYEGFEDKKEKNPEAVQHVERTLEPTKKISRSLQCTLGISEQSVGDDIVSGETIGRDEGFEDKKVKEHKAVYVKDKKCVESTLQPSKKISKSLQCTLGINDSPTAIKMEEIDTSTKAQQSSKLNENKETNDTPLVLRTVKKTYPRRGRTQSDASDNMSSTVGDTQGDATPKLTVSLTKKTYSRKGLTTERKIIDNMENVDEVGPSDGGEDVEKTTQNIKDLDSDRNDPGQVNENMEVKKHNKADQVCEDMLVVSTDNVQDKESEDEPKEKSLEKDLNESAKAPSMRMTRRRSILQQNEETSSISEGSITSTSETTGSLPRTRLMVPKTSKESPSSTESQGTEMSSQENRSSGAQSNVTTSTRDSLLKSQSQKGEITATSESLSQSSSKSSSRRVTRRLSQLSDGAFDSTLFIDTPEMKSKVMGGHLGITGATKDVMETDEEDISESIPGPSHVSSQKPSKASTKEILPSTSHNKKITKPKKRTRSASVDQPVKSIRKRLLRSKSIDLDANQDISPRDFSKRELKVNVEPLEEAGPSKEKEQIINEQGRKHGLKASSDVGAYTTSRRLTRRQASMLKAIVEVEKEVDKLPHFDEIDPIHLLDKSEFEGKSDPDESKVYEQSSPSGSSVSGRPSRHTRSASVISDGPSVSTPTKSKKISKTDSGHMESPVTGIKSRLRRLSTDSMSVFSEQSDSPSPSKKSKKKVVDDERENDSESVKNISKRTRSRASSVSSVKSNISHKTDTSVRTTRSRRIHSSKSELPEIQEEKGSEETESVDASVIKKRGRKKKNQS